MLRQLEQFNVSVITFSFIMHPKRLVIIALIKNGIKRIIRKDRIQISRKNKKKVKKMVNFERFFIFEAINIL